MIEQRLTAIEERLDLIVALLQALLSGEEAEESATELAMDLDGVSWPGGERDERAAL